MELPTPASVTVDVRHRAPVARAARRPRAVPQPRAVADAALPPGDNSGAPIPVPLPVSLHPLLRDLDGAQRRAVTHGDGPLLVVAGAGTGKTRVITRRIAWLIATKAARPSEILALTFTDRAADEMQARVDQLVPYGYVDTAIHTFHAFGDRLIREFAFELGLPSEPRVLTRPEAVIFMRERLFALGLERYRPLGDPTRFLDALAGLVSRAKDEDIAPAAYLAYAEAQLARARSGLGPEGDGRSRGPANAMARGAQGADAAASIEEACAQLELARAYARYQEMLTGAGCLDFGDQVHLALRLLREHPAVLERVRRRYRHVLVDEFQDTNAAQMALLELIVGPRGNLTVVGDDDQAIYAFRGAAVRNILDFRRRFGARVVVLRRNHRSRAPVLEAAQRLISHNDPDRLESREGLDKRLVAVRRSRRPAPVRHHLFATSADEADWIAARVAECMEAGVSPGDIAILVRANADADPILRSLNIRAIPWRFSGASGLYGRPPVRRLLAFLRAVADLDSTLDVYALATSEPYALGGPDMTRLVEAARRSNRSLWTLLRDPGTLERDLSAQTLFGIRRLVGDLDAATELAHARPAGEVLYDFLRRSGTLASLVAGGPGGEESLADVARFFEVVRRQCDMLPDPRVPFLAPHLRTLIEVGDDPQASPQEGTDAVSVLTVHKAKGLEFRVVFVAGLADGRFPLRGRRESLTLPAGLVSSDSAAGDAVAEERRLCFVAMTRARDELILTSASDTGGRRARRVSPFVAEALDQAPIAMAAPADLARLDRFARREAGPATERAAPGGPVGALSFTQIDDYLSCPARHRYRHVLRLPSPPHHALAYGVALHAALAALGRSQMQGRPLSEAGLLEALDRAWSSEGFLSREHEEARRAAGRLAVLRYRAASLAAASVPIAVEEPFAVILDGIRVQGRFDRVDEGPAGVVITDFKSSDVRDPARARERARDSLQLALYALAWKAREGRMPAAMQLAFLDSGVVGRTEPDRARLARAGERVAEAAEGIGNGRWEARPDPVGCRFCPFREICPSSAS